jgi:CubicO group peptidase (beta-lactamase class C family)
MTIGIYGRLSAGAALLLICCLPSTGWAQARAEAAQPSVAADRRAATRAEELARALHAAVGAPAMTVAVRRGDTLLWSAAYGTPSLESPVPLRPDAVFRAGSVSKLFTVAALMRLHREGRIDLDAPVQNLVPALAQHPPITLRQLAGHLGGIRHYRPHDKDLGLRHLDTVEASVALFAADPLVDPPGTHYAYTTFGYNALALAIEKAAGEPFLAAVRRLVFEPLRMTHSGPDDVRRIVPGRVAPYQREDGEVRNARFADPSYKWAGGGFVTSAIDLTAFGAAHLREDFLPAAARAQMFTSQRTAAGAETDVGIGWRVNRDWDGRQVYHHSGSQEGARSVLIVYPKERLSVAIMTNLDGEPPLIEASATALAAPFLASDAPPALPPGRWTVNGQGASGPFTGEIVTASTGGHPSVIARNLVPLDGFGAILGTKMPPQLSAPLVVAGRDGPVAFLLAPYGFVPVRMTWSGNALAGEVLLPPSPISFTFSGAPAAQ